MTYEIEGRTVVIKSLVGSHNYGLNTKDSDRDYKLIVTPTFEDLYSGKKYSNQVITETEDYAVHDIRKLTELLFKSNINYMEIFASNEMMIDEKFPHIKKMFEMREDIFTMNLSQFFVACKGMHKQKMSLLNKGTEGTQHLVDKFGYDTKQALHAYRVMKVAVDFEKNSFKNFDKILKYNGEELDFMLSIRNGFFQKEVFENFIEHYYESTFLKLEEKYLGKDVNFELLEEMRRLTYLTVQENLI